MYCIALRAVRRSLPEPASSQLRKGPSRISLPLSDLRADADRVASVECDHARDPALLVGTGARPERSARCGQRTALTAVAADRERSHRPLGQGQRQRGGAQQDKEEVLHFKCLYVLWREDQSVLVRPAKRGELFHEQLRGGSLVPVQIIQGL